MMPPVTVANTIAERIRSRARTETLAISRTSPETQQLVRQEVRAYYDQHGMGHAAVDADSRASIDAAEQQTVNDVLDQVAGLGPLQQYLDDPTIEEIWINAPSRLFVARNGVTELTDTVIPAEQLRTLVDRMLQHTGRRIDVSSPFVDASLPDGSRLHVVIPDISRKYPAINIRKFARRIRDLGALVERGALTAEAATFLHEAVHARCNIIVSGATHTGKTTMIGALLSAVGAAERIVTVEETFELDVVARDIVAMQCRQPSLEGTGEISLRRLVKEALRMRPDRLVVGEVREAEALELLIALNSGLPGMCSIHANSARDALMKLCTLPLLAGRNIDAGFVVPTVASAVDLVVHLGRDRNGHRQVLEIIAPTGSVHAGVIETQTVFARKRGDLIHQGPRPHRLAHDHEDTPHADNGYHPHHEQRAIR